MNTNSQAVVPLRTGVNLIPWNERQLATLRATLAPDANANEFNMFIQYCASKRLDPFVGHVILVIYGKANTDKRKATIITTQSGMRVMAERCGGYHPAKPGDTVWTYTEYEQERQHLLAPTAKIFNLAERTARIAEINENMPPKADNPFGLEECRTVIYKHGLPVEGIAYWTEFAPLTPHPDCFLLKPTGDYWKNKDGSQGREKMRKVVRDGIVLDDHMILDRSGRWGVAGKGMLAKCGNVNALKAGYPDHFDHNFNTEDTVEHLRVADVTASELAEIGEQERRANAIGKSKDEYAWTDADGNARYYPVGQFGDAVLKSVRACQYREDYVRLWATTLAQESFNRFWADHKNDALDVKEQFEDMVGLDNDVPTKLPAKPKPEAAATIEGDREASPSPSHA